MLSVDTIVSFITAPRSDIASLFLLAQYNIGKGVLERIEFEAVVQSKDDKIAYKQALEYAKTQPELYDEVIRMICNRGFEGGALLKQIGKSKKNKNGFLQGLANPAAGFISAGILSLMPKGRGWTGKVIINNKAKGSGVLIGPNRFLTAWHVVSEMFELASNTKPFKYIPKKNPPKLDVVFDEYDDLIDGKMQPKSPTKIKAAENWLEVFSNSHEDEFTNNAVDPTKLDGYWDYAIIRLKESVSLDRNWATLEPTAIVPDIDAQIFLFQYPGGYDQKFAIDVVTTLKPPIPDVRFLHKSNSDHGSSGGPCFDKEFFLVGIHQGIWPGKTKVRTKIINRGIAIRNIIHDIQAKKTPGPGSKALLGTNPEDYLAWYVTKEDYAPVIGIDEFQYLILQNLRSGKGYILLIKGDKKTGKTYCIEALSALLNDCDHLKIILPGEDVSKMDCLALANFICTAASSNTTKFESLKQYNSTKAAWLRDEVVQKVIGALESKRNSRMVWLCFTNLNVYDIKGRDTTDFLLLLYGHVKQNAWLQIILDGIKTDLPSNLRDNILTYPTELKKQSDIANYINRFLKELKITADPLMTEAFAELLFSQYQQTLAANPGGALKFLNEQCKAFLLKFMNRIQN